MVDGGIPVNGLLTSASTHHSQTAIALVYMRDERIVNRYDWMDSAHAVPQTGEVRNDLS